MPERPRVLLVMPQDTKGEDARYARDILEAEGTAVVHLDPSVRRTLGGAEIAPETVAAAAGTTIEAIRAIWPLRAHPGGDDPGRARLRARSRSRRAVARHPVDRRLDGHRHLDHDHARFSLRPAKLMVSTVASGFTRPYVGVKDTMMLNSVTDVSGLNSIAREVYRNAALATPGMAKGYRPTAASDRPLVLMTTLGTTETTARRIRHALDADGAEVMIFHSSGTGGPTVDAIADERDVALLIDLSVTKIVDHLFDGLADGGPDRARAALRRGVPVILAPGNADFIIGGPLTEARAKYPGRR